MKLELCTVVAQFSPVPVTSFILDHLCFVASMKEMAQFQKSGQNRLDRQYISAQLEVVSAAIVSIGAIGTNYESRQRHGDSDAADTGKTVGDSTNEAVEPLTRDETEKSRRSVGKACLDRLYQLLSLVSDFGNETERQKGDKASSAWSHQNLVALNLDESQVAMIQSTLLLAIEGIVPPYLCHFPLFLAEICMKLIRTNPIFSSMLATKL